MSVPLLYQPDAVARFINFTSLFFVSFTDFVVPWCLYIIMARNDIAVRPLGFIDHIQDFNTQESALDASPLMGLMAERITEHHAIPLGCKMGSRTKIRVSTLLVILMTGLSIAAIVETILQGDSMDWSCPTVGVGSFCDFWLWSLAPLINYVYTGCNRLGNNTWT